MRKGLPPSTPGPRLSSTFPKSASRTEALGHHAPRVTPRFWVQRDSWSNLSFPGVVIGANFRLEDLLSDMRTILNFLTSSHWLANDRLWGSTPLT